MHPAKPCAGPRYCAGLPTITCVQTPDSGSRSSSSQAALSRQSSAQRVLPGRAVQLGCDQHRARTPPHQLAVLVVSVVRDQLREALGVRARGCSPLEDEADPGLAEVQAPLVLVVGIIGDVLLLQIRDVVALELDEPATLQLVEDADHARPARVDGAKPPRCRFLRVVRVRRPAVVEGGLGLGDDLADRRLDRRSVPGLVEERFVALGIEESQR